MSDEEQTLAKHVSLIAIGLMKNRLACELAHEMDRVDGDKIGHEAIKNKVKDHTKQIALEGIDYELQTLAIEMALDNCDDFFNEWEAGTLKG